MEWKIREKKMESRIRTKWWEEQNRIPFSLKGFGRKTGEKHSIVSCYMGFGRKAKVSCYMGFGRKTSVMLHGF